ncbi:YhdP family protein [Paucibacter sp. APW11]|uniref:YhdP family protein n=1 Tax=Roseateles aquae TaxID=3077235 RepID=A0ABU3PAB9_9BURK|nr:YhdP family protein [Paucibacter sp. APW11]MDT8999513.1 YhdP family protein [Paucibacter sp. APW11]
MSFIASISAACHHPARWLRRGLRWALWLVLLAWGLVIAAWLALHWAILPHINDWRPALEQQASKALGLQLSIGQIELRSGGWMPALDLRDLRLADDRGRIVLRLPRVAAALSARSLLTLELRFEQLLIEGPELEVRRDKQGRIFVAGLSVDEEAERADSGAELADWFFTQHEFVIRHGRVRWIDEGRKAAPLELADLDLVMRNGLRRHQLRLDATPPQAWGQRFGLRGDFTQPLLQRAGDLAQWSGQLYADLPRADVRELRRYVDLPFELSEGDGALRGWAEIRQGQAQALTLDMGLRAVKLRLSNKVEPVQLNQVGGRLSLLRDRQGLKFAASQLGFELDGGLSWPRSDWSLVLQQTLPAARGASAPGLGLEGAPISGGELGIAKLDLALLGRIAGKLPLGPELHHWFGTLAPVGQLEGFAASWTGSLAAPQGYRVKGRLADFALQPGEAPANGGAGRPGFNQAELRFEASERGGQALLKITDGAVVFPGVFEQPVLAMKQFAANLNWRIDPREGLPPMIELRVGDVQLANEDLRGELEAVWRTGPGQGVGHGGRLPGSLDLSGRLAEGKAASVVHYLPLAVGAQARSYVRQAVLAGTARDVVFRVRGDLDEFPFDKRSSAGQFRIATKAEDVQLAYVPGQAAQGDQPAQPSAWPLMDKLNAELVFDRGSMSIRNGRTQVLGYELSNVHGGIKDLMHNQVLEIEGQGRGAMSDLLRFVRSSPVDEWTGQALHQATATGSAGLKLALQLPLNDINHSTVKGSVQLLGNDVRLRPDVPLLAGARARIDFDRKGMSLQAGTARVLGGDASFEGGSQKDGSLRFSGQGVVGAESLRRATELGGLARLGSAMNGQAAYRLQLGFKDGQSEIAISSTLQGMALDLPAPLKKDADTPLSLRYQTQLTADSTMGRPRDELRLELGNTVQAHYLRDLSGEQPRVLRGSLALEDSLAPLPASGVQLQANLGAVNLDQWQQAAQRLLGSGHVESIEGAGYTPTQLTLRVQQLLVSGRPLSKLTAGISRLPEVGAWRANLDAEQLSGYVEYRAARPAQPGRVYARLARLALPKSEAESVTQLMDKQPGSVPALDIVVDDFELRGKKLGRLEVEAQNNALTRDWALTRLLLKHPDAQLSANGQWLFDPASAQRRTVLDWKLDVADAGRLLERLGQGQVLRGGKGLLAGQLAWQGSPLSLDYGSLSGQLNVALDAGQFLKAEPGAARLLGVLSLQSLPRRFLLDFRDVFSDGFAFDGFGGDVKIERGVASSSNLRMKGVQAIVLMDGRADLAAETQDLRVLVVPDVNAGGASLAYAAINPAIGLGTFLAQLILRKPMAAAGTSEFHVTGSWEDPKVDKVEHRPVEAAPPAASAASAASQP